MNFLKQFLNPLKECPRCLGKGNVDWNDINRLNQELKWIPGPCAYCDGKGKINPKLELHTAADSTYLTTNLSIDERKKIINGDRDALERGKRFEENLDHFINQISFLHFNLEISPLKIAQFFLLGEENLPSYNEEKIELIDYIEKVISKTKQSTN